MIELVIRLLLLLTVVFGIAFGMSRLFRSRADQRAMQQIRDDILALKTGIEEGLFDRDEYERRAANLRQACEQLGIPVPELPARKKLRAEPEKEEA